MCCISEACIQSPENVSEANVSIYTLHQNSKLLLFTLALLIFLKKGRHPDTAPKPKNTSAREGRLTLITKNNSSLPFWKWKLPLLIFILAYPFFPAVKMGFKCVQLNLVRMFSEIAQEALLLGPILLSSMRQKWARQQRMFSTFLTKQCIFWEI